MFNDFASAYWADAGLREEFHEVHNILIRFQVLEKFFQLIPFMQVLKESNDGKAPNGFLLILGKNNMPDFAKSQVLRAAYFRRN